MLPRLLAWLWLALLVPAAAVGQEPEANWLHLEDPYGAPVVDARTWIVYAPQWGVPVECQDPIPWIREHGVEARSDAQGRVPLDPAQEFSLAFAETTEWVSSLAGAVSRFGGMWGAGPTQFVCRDASGDRWLEMVPRLITPVVVQAWDGTPVEGAEVRLMPHGTHATDHGESASFACTDTAGRCTLPYVGGVGEFDFSMSLPVLVSVTPSGGVPQYHNLRAGVPNEIVLQRSVDLVIRCSAPHTRVVIDGIARSPAENWGRAGKTTRSFEANLVDGELRLNGVPFEHALTITRRSREDSAGGGVVVDPNVVDAGSVVPVELEAPASESVPGSAWDGGGEIVVRGQLVDPFGEPHPPGEFWGLGAPKGAISQGGGFELTMRRSRLMHRLNLRTRAAGFECKWTYRVPGGEAALEGVGEELNLGVLKPFEEKAHVCGVVVDEAGRPVAGARVLARDGRSEPGDYPEEAQAWTDARGRFWIRPPYRDPSSGVVVAHFQGRYSQAVPFSPGAEDVTLALAGRASLEVSLELEDWVPTANLVGVLTLRASPSEANGAGSARYSRVHQGRLRFEGLEPGPHDLQLFALGAPRPIAQRLGLEVRAQTEAQAASLGDLRGQLRAVAVRPVDADGGSIRDAVILVRRCKTDSVLHPWDERAAAFEVPPSGVLALAAAVDAPLEVHVRAPGYCDRAAQVEPGVDVELEPSVKVTVEFPGLPMTEDPRGERTLILERHDPLLQRAVLLLPQHVDPAAGRAVYPLSAREGFYAYYGYQRPGDPYAQVVSEAVGRAVHGPRLPSIEGSRGTWRIERRFIDPLGEQR